MNKLTTLNKMANEIMINSLFLSGGTVSDKEIIALFTKHKFKYCTGKYAPTNKNTVTEINCPVYYQSGADKWGTYIKIWTLNEDWLNDDELKLYRKIENIWKQNIIKKAA